MRFPCSSLCYTYRTCCCLRSLGCFVKYPMAPYSLTKSSAIPLLPDTSFFQSLTTPVEKRLIPNPLDLYHSETVPKSQPQQIPRQPSFETAGKVSVFTTPSDESIEKTPLYSCSLCHFPLPHNSKPHYLPRTCNNLLTNDVSQIYCEDCWIWVYNLAICWACGEIVGRHEERVGFGWCWWHWGCLSCLVCRVS